MKLLEVCFSAELCTEAGWRAYDFYFDQPLTQENILHLKPLGSFVYLPALREPFFKVETHAMMLKGIQGQNHFRVAFPEQSPETLEAFTRWLDTNL